MSATPRNPKTAGAAPAQVSPGLEAAAALSHPLPVEQPAAHPSPAADGQGFIMASLVAAAAEATRAAALEQGLRDLGAIEAQECPAVFDTADAERLGHERRRDQEQAAAELISRRCRTRLDRTRSASKKVLFIYVLLAVGETALNTSAGVSTGEVVWLAAISFLGLAAAAVGIGWWFGTTLRDANDRIEAGPLPQDGAEGLETLFLPPGGRPRDAFTPALWVSGAFLMGMAVANGALIGAMRSEAGLSPAWGPVAGMLVLVAAAPPYLLRNKAADMLEEAERRAAAAAANADSCAQTMTRHTRAQTVSHRARTALTHAADAQYANALAGGWAQIAVNQTHIVGHTMPLDQLPASAKALDVAPRTTSLPQQPEPFVSDYDKLRRARRQEDAPGQDRDAETRPAPEVRAPFEPDQSLVSPNGHRGQHR